MLKFIIPFFKRGVLLLWHLFIFELKLLIYLISQNTSEKIKAQHILWTLTIAKYLKGIYTQTTLFLHSNYGKEDRSICRHLNGQTNKNNAPLKEIWCFALTYYEHILCAEHYTRSSNKNSLVWISYQKKVFIWVETDV